jgi:hypothetical protein
MSAQRLIEACQAAGVSLEIEGDQLFVEFDEDPPDALVEELRLHKLELVDVLTRSRAPTTGPDIGLIGCIEPPTSRSWIALFEERVLHWSLDGRLARPRVEAKRLAYNELLNRWHMQHGERVPRDLCAGCRRPIRTDEALDLIDGSRLHGGVLDCLMRHGDRWRAAASRALDEFGIDRPEQIW